MIGKKFERLTVVSQISAKKWHCVCDCGNTKDVYESSLLSGHRTTCGASICRAMQISDAKQKTTSIYIEDARKVHGLLYNYDSVDYKGVNSNIDIGCVTCNNRFSMRAGCHLSGQGCPKCGFKRGLEKRVLSFSDFVARAKAVHGNNFTYHEDTYTSATSATKVTCDVHGDFWQQANSHYGGRGCNLCGIQLTGEKTTKSLHDFIMDARSKHGDTYEYSDVEYTNSQRKVLITCRKHGNFLQSPSKHLNGRGCPSCSKTGFQRNKSGFLYLLSSGDITKVGVTNHNVSTRLKELKRKSGIEFSIINTWFFKDAYKCAEVELEILNRLRDNYSTIHHRFGGSTECFLKVNTKTLLEHIDRIINEKEIKK